MTTRPVPHARDLLPDQKRTGKQNTQICSLRGLSRCCCCCCLSWSARDRAARLDAIRTKPHRVRYCCRQPTITPRQFLVTAIFSSSRMHAAIMPRGFAPPTNPPGRMHTAGGRATYREVCRHVSPRFRLYQHLLSPRPPAAAAVEADAAAVAECTQPRRAT